MPKLEVLADELARTNSSELVRSFRTMLHDSEHEKFTDIHYRKFLKIKSVYLRDTVSGVGAAVVYVVSTYPLSKIQFRQQLGGIGFKSSLLQISEEGFRHLYRGLLPPLLQKAASRGIMFGSFDFYHDLTGRTVFSTFLAGNLTGWTEALLTPFERIQTLMQDRRYHERFRNSYHAFGEVSRMSFTELFRGGSVIFLRNGLSNAMFFALRDPVAESLDLESKFLRSFLSGALLGAVLSTLFYPSNVLKTHMQSRIGGPFLTIRQTFMTIYNARNRRISQFFVGYHLNYGRALLSWGIVNSVYEYLRDLLSDDRE